MRLETEIPDLIARAREGDEEAIRHLLSAFEEELRIMVRGRLPKKLRTHFDSMDFVQSVWQSFFSDLRSRPLEFANVHHLRAFLAGVVRNKVYEQHRRLRPPSTPWAGRSGSTSTGADGRSGAISSRRSRRRVRRYRPAIGWHSWSPAARPARSRSSRFAIRA